MKPHSSRTSQSPPRAGFREVDWFARNEFRIKSSAHDDQSQAEWLHSLDYFNPLNAIFTREIEDAQKLKGQKTWLFRDGEAGLKTFFMRCPTPRALHTKVYIHQKLKHLIPPAWRKIVSGFEYHRIKSTPRAEVSLIADVRDVGNHSNRPTALINLFPGYELSQPPHLTLVNIDDLVYSPDLHRYCLLSGESEAQVIDSYLVQLLLSRGGHVQGVPERVEQAHIELSPFHGLWLGG